MKPPTNAATRIKPVEEYIETWKHNCYISVKKVASSI